MEKSGSEFYDDEAVFTTYQLHRQRPDSPNETLEKPVIMDLIGDIQNQHILDLGCGDAKIGREFLSLGATSYLGVEGSHRMVAVAKNTLAGTSGQIIRAKIEDWTYPPDSFDLVIARLSLHYIADLKQVFSSLRRTLKQQGRFVFSVEHPVITSSAKGWKSGTLRTDWVVDDYFDTGVRITHWLGGWVKKYHRTVEDYFHLLLEARLKVEDLREASPQREHFQDLLTYERRLRIPLFLILAATKGS